MWFKGSLISRNKMTQFHVQVDTKIYMYNSNPIFFVRSLFKFVCYVSKSFTLARVFIHGNTPMRLRKKAWEVEDNNDNDRIYGNELWPYPKFRTTSIHFPCWFPCRQKKWIFTFNLVFWRKPSSHCFKTMVICFLFIQLDCDVVYKWGSARIYLISFVR